MVIIIGAGASYDSLQKDESHDINTTNKQSVFKYTDSYTPPLGNTLFNPIDIVKGSFKNDTILKYKGVRAIRPSTLGVQDVELYLENLLKQYQENGNKEAYFRYKSVILYLQELFIKISKVHFELGPSNYTSLIDRAFELSYKKNSDVCFISFNYDTLLEQAYEEISPNRIMHISDYVKDRIKIVKPHGSCNWLSLTKELINKSIDPIDYFEKHIDILNLDDDIHIMPLENFQDYIGVHRRRYNSKGASNENSARYMPRLVAPQKSKTKFVCPEDHIEVAKKALNETESILAIGWRGAEKKFQEILKETISDRPINVYYLNAGDNEIEGNLHFLNAKWIQINADPITPDLKGSPRYNNVFNRYVQALNSNRKGVPNFFAG